MVRLIRDYNTLSKRKQVGIGFVNMAISVVIIILVDQSIGTDLTTSIRNIIITLLVGVIFLVVYGNIQKMLRRRAEKV